MVWLFGQIMYSLTHSRVRLSQTVSTTILVINTTSSSAPPRFVFKPTLFQSSRLKPCIPQWKTELLNVTNIVSYFCLTWACTYSYSGFFTAPCSSGKPTHRARSLELCTCFRDHHRTSNFPVVICYRKGILDPFSPKSFLPKSVTHSLPRALFLPLWSSPSFFPTASDK